MKYKRDLSKPLAPTYGDDDKKKTHDKNRKIYLEKVNKLRSTHKVISFPSDKFHAVIVKREKPLASKGIKKASTSIASKMLKRFKKD